MLNEEELPDYVMEIVNNYEFLSVRERERGHKRIYCEYTKHEMVPSKPEIERYLQSAKLRKEKEWYSHDYSQYYPEHIVEHRDNPKMLYCLLTRAVLMKKPSVVMAHINGKKFNARLRRYEERERRRRIAAAAEKNNSMDGDESDDFFVNLEDDPEEEMGGGGMDMEEHSDDDHRSQSSSENEDEGGSSAEKKKRKKNVLMSCSDGAEEPGGGVRQQRLSKKRKLLERRQRLGIKKRQANHFDGSDSNAAAADADGSDSATAAAKAKKRQNCNDNHTPVVSDATWEAYKAKHTNSKIKKAREENESKRRKSQRKQNWRE